MMYRQKIYFFMVGLLIVVIPSKNYSAALDTDVLLRQHWDLVDRIRKQTVSPASMEAEIERIVSSTMPAEIDRTELSFALLVSTITLGKSEMEIEMAIAKFLHNDEVRKKLATPEGSKRILQALLDDYKNDPKSKRYQIILKLLGHHIVDKKLLISKIQDLDIDDVVWVMGNIFNMAPISVLGVDGKPYVTFAQAAPHSADQIAALTPATPVSSPLPGSSTPWPSIEERNRLECEKLDAVCLVLARTKKNRRERIEASVIGYLRMLAALKKIPVLDDTTMQHIARDFFDTLSGIRGILIKGAIDEVGKSPEKTSDLRALVASAIIENLNIVMRAKRQELEKILMGKGALEENLTVQDSSWMENSPARAVEKAPKKGKKLSSVERSNRRAEQARQVAEEHAKKEAERQRQSEERARKARGDKRKATEEQAKRNAELQRQEKARKMRADKNKDDREVAAIFHAPATATIAGPALPSLPTTQAASVTTLPVAPQPATESCVPNKETLEIKKSVAEHSTPKVVVAESAHARIAPAKNVPVKRETVRPVKKAAPALVGKDDVPPSPSTVPGVAVVSQVLHTGSVGATHAAVMAAASSPAASTPTVLTPALPTSTIAMPAPALSTDAVLTPVLTTAAAPIPTEPMPMVSMKITVAGFRAAMIKAIAEEEIQAALSLLQDNPHITGEDLNIPYANGDTIAHCVARYAVQATQQWRMVPELSRALGSLYNVFIERNVDLNQPNKNGETAENIFTMQRELSVSMQKELDVQYNTADDGKTTGVQHGAAYGTADVGTQYNMGYGFMYPPLYPYQAEYLAHFYNPAMPMMTYPYGPAAPNPYHYPYHQGPAAPLGLGVYPLPVNPMYPLEALKARRAALKVGSPKTIR